MREEEGSEGTQGRSQIWGSCLRLEHSVNTMQMKGPSCTFSQVTASASLKGCCPGTGAEDSQVTNLYALGRLLPLFKAPSTSFPLTLGTGSWPCSQEEALEGVEYSLGRSLLSSEEGKQSEESLEGRLRLRADLTLQSGVQD